MNAIRPFLIPFPKSPCCMLLHGAVLMNAKLPRWTLCQSVSHHVNAIRMFQGPCMVSLWLAPYVQASLSMTHSAN